MRMKYGHKDRFNYQQHGPGIVCINRTLIQQRLLVKFSCNPHINRLLRALLVCVTIRLCNQWLSQQKTAFSIPKDAYKPIVTFFELTNLLSTFQTIMNNLLRNLIETEDVATFIDDIIVGTETEKYVQKVREVGFLEVIIESDEVKREKEKVYRKLWTSQY